MYRRIHRYTRLIINVLKNMLRLCYLNFYYFIIYVVCLRYYLSSVSRVTKFLRLHDLVKVFSYNTIIINYYYIFQEIKSIIIICNIFVHRFTSSLIFYQNMIKN